MSIDLFFFQINSLIQQFVLFLQMIEAKTYTSHVFIFIVSKIVLTSHPGPYT